MNSRMAQAVILKSTDINHTLLLTNKVLKSSSNKVINKNQETKNNRKNNNTQR